MKMLGLTVSTLLAACGAAVSFRNRAQNSAMGTWGCNPDTGTAYTGANSYGTTTTKSPELEAVGIQVLK